MKDGIGRRKQGYSRLLKDRGICHVMSRTIFTHIDEEFVDLKK
jgi:hypothetical protein